MYEKSMPMTLTWEEKLNACKNAGFDWVKISIDESDEKIGRLYDRDTIEEIKKAIRTTGVPIFRCCKRRGSPLQWTTANSRSKTAATSSVRTTNMTACRHF